MKYLKLIPHALVLLIFSIAEGMRLEKFLVTIMENPVASFSLAAMLLLIVFYFKYEQFNELSVYATIVCIVISALSYAEPIRTKFQEANHIEKKDLLPIPVYDFQGKWWHEKVAYIAHLESQRKMIEKQNAEIEKWNASQEAKGLDWYGLSVLVAAALIFSLFVPMVVYHVSHRLAEMLRNADLEVDQKTLIIAEVLQKKKTIVAISAEYNVSRDTIYTWINELGIPTNKRQPKDKGKTTSNLILTGGYV